MSNKRRYYKGQFFIVFYDKNDEWLEYSFDNVREILKFMKRDINTRNINLVNVELYRALKSADHLTKFLTGDFLKVYAIPVDDDVYID